MNPQAPSTEELKNAWESLHELSSAFSSIESIYDGVMVLRRAESLTEAEQKFLARYGPGIQALFEASQTLSRKMGEDLISTEVPAPAVEG